MGSRNTAFLCNFGQTLNDHLAVLVLTDGCVGGQLLRPLLVAGMQPTLVMVEEHGCRTVRRIYRGQCFPCAIAALIPLTIEVPAAIGRVLSNHSQAQLLRLKTNPTATRLTGILPAKRAESKRNAWIILDGQECAFDG